MAKVNGAEGVTRNVAKFYAELDYESLSPQTVDNAKYFCLDYLAMALRGASSDSSLVMQRGVSALTGAGDSLIMGNLSEGDSTVRGPGQRHGGPQPRDGRYQQRRIDASRRSGIPSGLCLR